MIFCVHKRPLSRRDYLETKCGYTINKIGPTVLGYSYMVKRPSGSVLVWVGAEHREARKMAIRACLDDIRAITT